MDGINPQAPLEAQCPAAGSVSVSRAEHTPSPAITPLGAPPVDTKAGHRGSVRAEKKAQARIANHPISQPGSQDSEDEESTSSDERQSAVAADEADNARLNNNASANESVNGLGHGEREKGMQKGNLVLINSTAKEKVCWEKIPVRQECCIAR